MKLYFHPISQHSRRVRMLCHELALVPELVPVAIEKGEHRTAQYLALNPAHAVPVLEDGGVVLAESHAIMRYLCQRYDGARLYPSDAAARAKVDRWLDWTHCSLNPPVQTLAIQLLFAGDERVDSLVETSRQSAREALNVLDTALREPQGIGGALTIADLAIATTLALYEMCGGSFDDVPRVGAYYAERLKPLPSFTATAPSMPGMA